MVCYCCDLCGARTTDPYKVALPRLFPKDEVYVMGQKVSQSGEEWRVVKIDLCKECMEEVGNQLNGILREEI